MNLKRPIPTSTKTARWLLQAGLAFVFAYAGVESLRNPNGWIGYVPTAATHVVAAATFLKMTAVVELLLAGWLMTGRFLQYAAIVSALMLLGIITGNPHAWDITFRDVGLLLASLALMLSAE